MPDPKDEGADVPDPKDARQKAAATVLADAEASSQRPWGIWFISVTLGVEAVALFGAAIFSALSLIGGRAEFLASGIFLTFLCLGFGALIGAVSWQISRGYRWTRAVTFVWQLLMLALIVPAVLSGRWIALLFLIPPMVVLVLLFTPRVVAFTVRQGHSRAL